jgi:hypothetical protein
MFFKSVSALFLYKNVVSDDDNSNNNDNSNTSLAGQGVRICDSIQFRGAKVMAVINFISVVYWFTW